MTGSGQFTAFSPTQGTLQRPLLKPCPIHSTLHTSVKQIIQEHFEYLSIYMHYEIFPSCQTIIDIGTMYTYRQQNSTPCPSKQFIRVFPIVFTPQKLHPLMFADQAIGVNVCCQGPRAPGFCSAPGDEGKGLEQDQSQLFLTTSPPSQHFRGSPWTPQFSPACVFHAQPVHHLGHTTSQHQDNGSLQSLWTTSVTPTPGHAWGSHRPCSLLSYLLWHGSPVVAPLLGIGLPWHLPPPTDLKQPLPNFFK